MDTGIRVALLWLMLGAAACSDSTSPSSPTDVDPGAGAGGGSTAAPSQITVAVVDLTNAERTRASLAPLRSSARLMQAAQLHADQMARIGRLDHVLPEGQYPRPDDRLAAAGYRWQAYAENVAYNQRGPEEVVRAWMNSSGHRANILNGSLTEIGVGYARDASGRPYWVQVFGRPAP